MTQNASAHEALIELARLVEEASTRWAGEEWNLTAPGDQADARRALAHILQGALAGYFDRLRISHLYTDLKRQARSAQCPRRHPCADHPQPPHAPHRRRRPALLAADQTKARAIRL